MDIKDKIVNFIVLVISFIVWGLVDFDGVMKIIWDLDRISFVEWFFSKGGNEGSLKKMWDSIVYVLGFIDMENIFVCCMLIIF